MIEQSAGVVDAQQHADVRVDVEIEAEPFGPVPGAPMLGWSLLAEAPLHGSFALGDAMAAVGLADGSMLFFRWDTGDSEIQVATLAHPAKADSWLSMSLAGTGPATSGTVLRLAAARHGDTIRIVWATGAGVYTALSTDQGSTWGTTETLYAGADVDDRHIGVFYSGGCWIVGWTTVEPRLTVAWSSGGPWFSYTYYKNFRFSGALVLDGYLVILCYTDLSLPTVGTSYVRRLVVDLGTGSLLDTLDTEIMIGGQAGTNFYNLFYRNVHGDEINLLGEAVEGGVGGGYLYALSSVFDGAVGGEGDAWDVRIDEPVQARWLYANYYATSVDVRHELAGAGGNVYAIHANGTHSEVWIGRPVSVPRRGYAPISYEYDWHLGRAYVELSATGETPVIGSLLTVTRRVSRAGRRGKQAVKMIVMQVERWRDRVRVLALDGSGWLGTYRARRTARLADGREDLEVSVKRLAARGGLRAQMTETVQDQESFAVTHSAGESAKGALFRLLATGHAVLNVVPGEFAIQLSRIGDNCHEPQRYAWGGGIPIADAYSVEDGRRFSASYILGQKTTDPADGSFLRGWTGPVLPGVRPIAVSYTNSRYNSPLLVDEAANAEAHRQLSLHTDAIIQVGPNLALEMFDRVTVSWPDFDWWDREFRVHRVIEKWDHEGMVHELHLGDVTYMYDIWAEEECDYAFDWVP